MGVGPGPHTILLDGGHYTPPCNPLGNGVQSKYYTSIAFTKSLVYALQPFIFDAYQINHCTSQKLPLKSPLVNFK